MFLAALGFVFPGLAEAGTIPSGNSSLMSVSCPTDTFCMAVGGGFADRFDGTNWHAMLTAAPPRGYASAGLYDVSCTSATFCAAFGTAQNTPGDTALIAERWDGSSWRRVTIQGPIRRLAARISCVGKSECMAVGSQTYTFTSPACHPICQRLEPRTWQLIGNTFQFRPAATRPFPYAYLTAVSCVAADNCTAVGDETQYDHPLAEHWNGRTWRWLGRLPYPRAAFTDSGPFLYDVSCPAPRSCVVVGESDDGFALVINRNAGSVWRYGLPGPHRDPEEFGGTPLDSVSCSVYHRCAAVGTTIDRSSVWHSVLAWRDFRTGRFAFPQSPAFFTDVSCRARVCTYVGYDDANAAAYHAVIYRGGAHPTEQSIPAPPG